MIVTVGNGFSNNPTQYDEFVPGSLFGADDMDGFSVDVEDFDITWLTEGPAKGQARSFVVPPRLRDGRRRERHLRPAGQPPAGHRRHRGLPDRARLRPGRHDQATATATWPTAARRSSCRPDQTFAASASSRRRTRSPARSPWRARSTRPFALGDGLPRSVFGDAVNPLMSLFVYTGDLGLDDGRASRSTSSTSRRPPS